MKLSVIIPTFNEDKTLPAILDRILAVSDIEKEVIIVNDGSTDGTRAFLKRFDSREDVVILEHRENRGKGAAIRTARNHATGDICIIQDADLECDPADYGKLMTPIGTGRHRVVYGSRRFERRGPRPSFMRFYVARIVLSVAANILYRQRLTDEPTCYKVFETTLFKSIPLQCRGFEFCPEITAKISKRGIKIVEVPIRYIPRTTGEGKKIRWTDGVIALWTLIKYRFVD
jgi:glycosyltransferase involved in cell wall biosynthesis